jgi:hypothetical protein
MKLITHKGISVGYNAWEFVLEMLLNIVRYEVVV